MSTLTPIRHSVLVLLAAAMVMTVFESTKQLIFPGITLWQSHTLTIFVSSCLASVAAFFVSGEHQVLHHRTLLETTARQQADAERDRFFSLAQDMLCIASTDGYFKRVNPAFSQTLGWSDEELLARPAIAFTHPDDRKATLQEAEKLAAGQPSVHFENRYECKDGTWKWLAWKTMPQPDGQLYSTARDVTERKRIEEQMARNLQELSDFKSALDEHAIVSITDTSGIITYVNDKLCAVSKHAREDLLGRDHRLFNSGHHPKAYIREMWQTITGGKVWKGELKNRAKDGSVFWVDSTIVPFRDERGRLSQFFAVRTDITERKQAEEQIEKLNGNLQHRAEQLVESNKELEAFCYSVSHDLRAPLRHVQGYVEMLQRATEGQLSEKALRFLKTISDASSDMGQLIDDLLEFSRMGRVGLNEGTVALDGLVKEALKSLEMAVDGRNIEWKIAPLPEAVGDSALIRQVLANLLGNAIKYSRRRDPARIEIGLSGEEKGRMILFVRDNGAGFDMQYAHKLFGVFQRLHRPEEFEGTGIGLANVRRIIVRHGGRVWAEGKLNEGATFYFTLKPAAAA